MAAMVVEVVEVLEVVVDVYMVADHRAVDFCRFWEPHRAGEVLPIFFENDRLLFLVLQRRADPE